MVKNYRKLIAIKASEAGKFENPQWINVLNCGHWDTNYQGSFTVTADDLAEMVANFNNDVRKGVPIDTNHDNAEANGWITKLEVRGDELWALCEWTPLGEDKLVNKIFKFLSPEFAPVYHDPETNQFMANNVLIAAALTNFPLMKGLQAVVANESKDKIYLSEESTMENEAETKEEAVVASDEVVENEPKVDEVVDDAPEAPEAAETIEAAEAKPKVEEEMTDDDMSPAKRVKQKKEQKEDIKEDDDKEACDKKAEAQPEDIKAAEGESLEEEVNDIADAFAKSDVNVFKNQWYGYKIVGTYENEDGTGHIILVADPDCDSTDWSDLAHVKYYQVNFKEDEATEAYVFDEPILVKPEFVPAPEEKAEADSYNEMMIAKEAELKSQKAEEDKPAETIETPVEAPAEEKENIVLDTPEEIKDDTVAAEFTEEAIRDMERKGITKIKCSDGVVKEIKDGQIIEPSVEKVEEKPEVAEVVAIEGSNVTITASEYQAFLKAQEELRTKQAAEVVSSLVFNEKIGVRMPTEVKDNLVSFYLKLNEGMRTEFTAILEKIPAAKVFNEIGDAGDNMSAQGAYEAIGKRADEIMAAEPHLNRGQAVQKARHENAELAKLANEHKAAAK